MYSLQFTARAVRPSLLVRTFATSTPIRSSWSQGPAPPRLPREEQEIFEQLQKQSTGAFSTPRQVDDVTASSNPSAIPDDAGAVKMQSNEASKMLEQLRERARIPAKGDGEELHPNVRRGAPNEFEGDTNPKTGEVGGPKSEPMRWGAESDWSYNGRVTDF